MNNFNLSYNTISISRTVSPKNISNIKLSAILKNLNYDEKQNSSNSSSKYNLISSAHGGNISASNANNTHSFSKCDEMNISLPVNSKSRNSISKISRQGSKQDSMNSIDVKKKNALPVKIPISCKKIEGISNFQKYIKNVKIFFNKII